MTSLKQMLLNKELYLGAMQGDLEQVKNALAAGAEINRVTSLGTALVTACSYKHMEVARYLMDHGADIHQPNLTRVTPLMAAAHAGLEDLCLRMIREDADVNAKDHKGHSPLFYAAAAGHIAISKLLLEHEADIDASNNDRDKPLLEAIKHGDTDMCRLLLEHGASVNIGNHKGSALQHALRYPMATGIPELLLDHSALPELGDLAETFNACIDGKREDIALRIIESGTVPPPKARPFIVQAVVWGQTKLAEKLIDLGENINLIFGEPSTPGRRTPPGLSLLECAIATKRSDTSLMLIKKGIKLPMDGNPLNLLEQAAKAGLEDVCLALMKKGFDINKQDSDGVTPLMHAARAGHEKLCLKLIEEGADPRIRNNSGLNLFTDACTKGLGQLAQKLLELGVDTKVKGDKGEYNMHEAAHSGLSDTVFTLIDRGANMHDASGPDKISLLHNAAFAGHTDLCIRLLEKGMKVDVKNAEGETPLHDSVAHPETCRALIERKATINMKDNQGFTALMRACNQYPESAHLLLDNNAGKDSKSENYAIALSFAMHGQDAIAEKIVNSIPATKENLDEFTNLLNLAIIKAPKIAIAMIDKGADVSHHLNGSKLLESAASHRHEDVCMKLLDKNVEASHTAIEECARAGMTNVCMRIINQMTDETVKNSWLEHTLRIAIDNKKQELCEKLFEAGADLSKIAYDGAPEYFTKIVENGWEEMAMKQLEKGIKPTALNDEDGKGPLLLAIKNEQPELALALIEHKADITKTGYDGIAPFVAAANAGMSDVCLALIKSGTDPYRNNLLFHASKNNLIDVCKVLIDQAVDLEEGVGNTPLLNAARYGLNPVCKLLIENGANIKAESFKDWTVLRSACDNHHSSTQKLLLQQGFPCHRRNLYAAPMLNIMEASVLKLFSEEAPVSEDMYMKNGKPTEAVLNACATDHFLSHIANPLLDSGKQEHKELLKKLYAALPKCWRTKNISTPALIAKAVGNSKPPQTMDTQPERGSP